MAVAERTRVLPQFLAGTSERIAAWPQQRQ
jgi:hypothetical protein